MRSVHSLSSPEFQALFRDYSSSAFRLETLQEYAVGYEEKPFQDFLAGVPKYTDRDHIEWVELIRTSVKAGKSMSRVHLIEEPLTDYLKFELLWPYRDNVDAGDEIGLVVVEDGQWPKGIPRSDFWLFDDRLVADMKYNEKFGFVEALITDEPKVVEDRIRARDAALAMSIPYEDYITRIE